MNEEKRHRIIQIDAWAEDDNHSWNWNDVYNVGFISAEELDAIENSTRKVLEFMRNEGYLSKDSQGKFTVEKDDMYITILYKKDSRPVFAIDYSFFD